MRARDAAPFRSAGRTTVSNNTRRAAGTAARGVLALSLVSHGGDRQRVLRAADRRSARRVRTGVAAGLSLREQSVGSDYRAPLQPGRALGQPVRPAEPGFPECRPFQGGGTRAVRAGVSRPRGRVRVRVPGDAWTGPALGPAMGGRARRLLAPAAARLSLCG